MGTLRATLIGLGVLAAAGCVSADADSAAPGGGGAAPPRLEVEIRPEAAGGAVQSIAARLMIEGPGAEAGEPLLRMPMVFAATESARYEADELTVTDAVGPLALVQTDDPVDPNNSIYFRRWAPARATQGDVEVSFRAPGELFGPRTTIGPPFNLMRQDGGFSGAGMIFLVVPDTQRPYSISMRWDLSDMPTGARGVWSLGEGAVDTVGPSNVVQNAYYMAGPAVSSYPPEGGGAFGIYWMGEPRFDIDAVGAWIVEAYAAMSSFFDTPGRPFRVFLRENPNSAYGGGGAGLVMSFMAGYGELEDVSVEGMRSLLAHEMAHNWPGSLAGPVGTASWYGEGMAEHYDPLLTFRAGLLTPEEFIGDANARARAYYTNTLNRLPAEEIAALFWRDGRARRLPYQRGSLYLAQVDAQMRAASDGARSLDDLTLAMIARRDRGESYDAAAWRELLRAELGGSAVAEFDAMMAGDLLHPPSDSFGPCFARVEAIYGVFELGFDPQILSMAPPRVVTGLDPDSNAARAGLREGDVIVNVVPIDHLTEDSDRLAELQVRRGETELGISYSPWGEAVDGYRWERRTGVRDEACNVWGELPR